MGPICVLLVEDHHLVREGLRALIDEDSSLEVVGQATDGHEALSLAASLEPDLVIMDLRMPNLNGLEAATRMMESDAPPQIIMLSQYRRTEYVVEALRAGVKGYLLKDALVDELHNAIQEVTAGRVYLSPELDHAAVDYHLQHHDQTATPLDRLTTREREVLQLVAEGHTNRQIANQLAISIKTVEKHRFNLMDKLNIRDVAGLVRFAIENGLIDVDLM
ncbi:MAG: response regulator transcription factor [Chloroflexi bacterium]|nr:response regulator transcription factor [Chloroflexota bacterium]